MIIRTLALATGLATGVAASQMPEYAQQYRQRLGGAVDELARMLADFDADAGRFGMTREQGVARLSDNTDKFVNERGVRLREESARLARLERQLATLRTAGPFARIASVASEADPVVARRAWANFEPAVPVTTEGVVLGGGGFLAGYGVFHAILWPFRRRQKPRIQGASR